MTVRIEVRPALLQWARARSGIDDDVWDSRFPRFGAWVAGETRPTLRQLEEFARKTYTPVGYFFLDEPPTEDIPIPDFRTIGDRPVSGPVTADLLDTLYICQARQEWYRDSQLLNGEAPLDFVGSATVATPPVEVAASMRDQLRWTPRTRERLRSSDDALAALRENAEAAGILVMVSGIVGSNTHRKLDPSEFRGFAFADPYAALVFVNGTDSNAAQVFTLAHEVAHLWLGSTALSDVDPASARRFDEERWCNQVAAELLVPMDEFSSAFLRDRDIRSQLQPLAERFRVSTQVILARIREAGRLSWDQFMAELRFERAQVAEVAAERGSGGNYYNTKPVQVGKRFARELIASTLEGRTTYTEAFRLLDVKKTSTFEGLGHQLGIL
ncbi:ImmA/IrrE family metallo-endopeptidase [Candidatus Poriferisodalis sp.]|uniref:ImmA/IrrE family metallo-endopeptidase n=1 Tax=Candidatus Poriferisodalis sp. TaxID=3101277 RepID=UPI003B594DDB